MRQKVPANVKGVPLRKKITFSMFFFFLGYEISNIFCLRRHIQLLFIVYKCIVLSIGKITIFNRFLKYLPGLKLWLFYSKKKMSKSVSGYFKTKQKSSYCHYAEGGGGATKNIISFLRLPIM